MFTCLWNGRSICSFDVRNKYDKEDFELKRAWKTAQAKNELTCDDCGSPMDFRPGKGINAPHFAHKSNVVRDCFYDRVVETKEHKLAMEILNYYFRDKYPDTSCYIKFNKKHPNDRRSDIFIEFDTGENLAVEFQKTNLNWHEWELKHSDYVEMGINELWLLSTSVFKKDQVDIEYLAQILLHENDKIAKFLDVDRKLIKLVKQINYLDSDGIIKKQKLFTHDYSLDSLIIHRNGIIESNFDSLYEAEKNLFFKACEDEETTSENISNKFRSERPFDNEILEPRPIKSIKVDAESENRGMTQLESDGPNPFSSVFQKWMNQLELGGPEQFSLILGECYESIESDGLNGFANSGAYAHFPDKLIRCEEMIKAFDTLDKDDFGRLKIRLAHVATVLLGEVG